MIATVEDAQKWWCPHGQLGDGTRRARIGEHCIASECSQWRWYAGSTPASEGKPVGYCGLAGKPKNQVYDEIYF